MKHKLLAITFALATCAPIPANADMGNPISLNFKPLDSNSIEFAGIKTQDEPAPKNPFGLTLGWATDKQTYAMTSTVWEYDWRGFRGVNAVALAGIRLSDNIPVVGGGLEWGIQFPLAKRVDFYGTLMIGGIWEQNESIDKVRGVGTLKVGVVIF